MHIEDGNLSLTGELLLQNCRSAGSGGGLLVHGGGVHQHPGSDLKFFKCFAQGGNGGGLAADDLNISGKLEFHKCKAISMGAGSKC